MFVVAVRRWVTSFASRAERHNVASEQPAVYNQMYAAILELNKTVYSPIRGTDDGTACEKAAGIYGGFWYAAHSHTYTQRLLHWMCFHSYDDWCTDLFGTLQGSLPILG